MASQHGMLVKNVATPAVAVQLPCMHMRTRLLTEPPPSRRFSRPLATSKKT